MRQQQVVGPLEAVSAPHPIWSQWLFIAESRDEMRCDCCESLACADRSGEGNALYMGHDGIVESRFRVTSLNSDGEDAQGRSLCHSQGRMRGAQC